MTKEEIANELINYVKTASLAAEDYSDIPRDVSLLEIGIFDSFGIVELVAFIEDKWKITIDDNELSIEKFGSIDKMSSVIFDKLHNEG